MINKFSVYKIVIIYIIILSIIYNIYYCKNVKNMNNKLYIKHILCNNMYIKGEKGIYMKKKILLSGLLVSILAIGSMTVEAGTKSKSFSYGSTQATGYLTTTWSLTANDQGYVKTSRTAGSLNVATYIESQDTMNGPRTDYRTASGNGTNTSTISRKGVWRFNSSHYIQNGGSNVVTAYQTDW